jgi:hypothetical protein
MVGMKSSAIGLRESFPSNTSTLPFPTYGSSSPRPSDRTILRNISDVSAWQRWRKPELHSTEDKTHLSLIILRSLEFATHLNIGDNSRGPSLSPPKKYYSPF